jgi:SpoU rRNA methylase family enzyme
MDKGDLSDLYRAVNNFCRMVGNKLMFIEDVRDLLLVKLHLTKNVKAKKKPLQKCDPIERINHKFSSSLHLNIIFFFAYCSRWAFKASF